MSEPDESTWRPVVTDPERREQILAILREIDAAVMPWPIEERELEGFSDRAVMRTYLAQDGTIADDERAGELLAQLVTRFGQGGYPACLFGGAARVSWTVAHLAGGETADEACRAIATALRARLTEDPWVSDYDLIIGLVGMGVCALERSDHEDGRQLSARVLEVLEATAQERGGGAAWLTSPELLPEWQRAISPGGYYNLGLAHGIPGVVALLARMVAHDVETPRARALLERAMTFMLNAEPPRERGRFPSWHQAGEVGPGHERELGSTRLAWCYGDLGASVALLSAAQATANDEWRTQAVDLARLCAGRTIAEAVVHDAGICHGAGGAAHIFNRLWHATGEEIFADAARRWIDQLLAMRIDHAIAGFPSADRLDGQTSWKADDSLLTGAVGVALVLHAAVSTVEPSWDRLLLVDVATA
ncbi:MAG: lanthionine synthetase C family protein [Deltaproteobacteria bacterium]|nr:lanthionine synthetase C family protein [Deltaproteobacteria bacterium]